jgi:tetratricopeptide (TPR) repeat protein
MFHLDEARQLAEEAVQWAVKAGDERMRGSALNNLGIIDKLQQEYHEALKVFVEVEELFARLGNDEAVIAAAGNRGEVLAALGQFEEAERVQRAVLQVSERLDRRDTQGANCLSLGMLAQLRRDFDGAQDWFKKARDVFRSIKDPSNEAFALHRLAALCNQFDRFEEAVAIGESALPLVGERHAMLISDLWNDIGLASFKRGYVGRAEEAYRRVYSITTEHGVERPHAAAAMNIGTALLLQQRDDEAAKYFGEAGEIWARVGDSENRAYCDLCVAAVQLDQRIAALSNEGHATPDPERARAAAREMVALYPELIAMYEEIGAAQLVAEFLASAGSTAQFAGQLDLSVAWYRRAASAFYDIGLEQRARQSLERGEDLLRRWANALMQRQEMAAALPVLLQLAEVTGQLGYREKCAKAMFNAAIAVLSTSQNYAAAKDLAKQALELFDSDSTDAADARKLINFCDSQAKPS